MDEELKLTGDGEERHETGRVEAFSDGVFAIAITLLILDLNVPEWSDRGPGLFKSLVDLWPSYLAFLTSFATIGVMWVNHHRIFTHIKRSDNMLLLLNGLLLLGVTIVPFPTKALARYLGHDPDEAVAAMLYSGLFILISIFFNVLWRYASDRDRLLGKRVNRREVDSISRQYQYGPLPYAVAFILAAVGYWFSPLVFASVLINLGLAVYFAIPSSTAASVRSRK